MRMSAQKFGDWDIVKKKMQGLPKEADHTLNEISKDVPKEYQKEVQDMIVAEQIEPDNDIFDSKEYANNVKVHQGVLGKKEIFVGLQEPLQSGIREFALRAEYEDAEYIGLWRSTTARFLDRQDTIREVHWNNLAAWSPKERKKI